MGEGTFAGTRGNDENAPIPDLPALTPERGGSLRVIRCLPVTGSAAGSEGRRLIGLNDPGPSRSRPGTGRFDLTLPFRRPRDIDHP
jgi:hypothetical protein